MDEARVITEECRPFLRALHGADGLLLRGFDEPTKGDFLRLPTPKDRIPKNMPLFFHRVADQWFFDRFGVRYRSNVVICAGDWKTAASYGNVYAVFPVGPFSVCWSSVVQDLFVRLCEHFPGDRNSEPDILDFLESLAYQEGALAEAIRSKNELLVNCNSFVGVSIDPKHRKERLAELCALIA